MSMLLIILYVGIQGEGATHDGFKSVATIDKDFAFESGLPFPIRFEGNLTRGFGADSFVVNPVIVAAGTTLTVEDGVKVKLVSNYSGLLALVGTDETSSLVVSSAADVECFYEDEYGVLHSWYKFEPGIYFWDSFIGEWVLDD